MLYIDSIWEYIVNFLELALFIIFIHKKLRIRANYKHQAVLMFLFVSFQFAVLCTLNKMGISSYSTLMSSCVLDIGYAVLFYRDSIIRRIFWGFSYSIICLVAEQISFFIPVTLYKGASLELLLGGTLRKPYTMLYLAMIAVFVLLFLFYWKQRHISFTVPKSCIYFHRNFWTCNRALHIKADFGIC